MRDNYKQQKETEKNISITLQDKLQTNPHRPEHELKQEQCTKTGQRKQRPFIHYSRGTQVGTIKGCKDCKTQVMHIREKTCLRLRGNRGHTSN